MAVAMWSVAQAQQGPPANPGACNRIGTAATGSTCYEAAAGDRERPQSGPNTTLPEGWRLIRAVDPAGGEAVAVARTAEMTKSDPDFAGMMLRCDKDGIGVLVILLRPLRVRATPRVRLTSTGGEARDFRATIAPPGTAVRLPSEVTSYASGPWQSATELSIAVDSENGTIAGVVSLAGLRSAWGALVANCPAS